MMNVTLSQLATVLNGELLGDDHTVASVVTDTRQLTPGCLFVALAGERFDGHEFVPQAEANGAVATLVQRVSPHARKPQLRVANTRQALSQMAGWWRAQMPARVVALTGSAGKTSVKEMTAAILRQCGDTLFTHGNLNNDIGVPLTLLRLRAQHQYAVIEAGASHTGEISQLVSLIRPDAALVTNLSAAHLAGFGSLAGVAQAKGEIFSGLSASGTAIINADSHDLANWQRLIGDRRLWRFSASGHDQRNATDSDFYISQLCAINENGASGYRFTLHTPAGAVDITLPLPGRHNLANALAAAALALAVDAPLSAIQHGLAQVKPVPGRLFPLTLAKNQRLIDDSYNANEASMRAAIAVLAEQPGFRVLVAGDMAELGSQAADIHRQIGEAAREARLDCVLTVGTLSELISQHSGTGEHFAAKAALLTRLRQLLVSQPVISILVKGSRSAAMEQIVQALQTGQVPAAKEHSPC